MTKLTPQELDERIDHLFAVTKTLEDGSPDKEPAKQLIRDCIEAVTPTATYDSEFPPDEFQRGYNGAIDTIQANTRSLLG